MLWIIEEEYRRIKAPPSRRQLKLADEQTLLKQEKVTKVQTHRLRVKSRGRNLKISGDTDTETK